MPSKRPAPRPTVTLRAVTIRHVVALLRAAEDEWATSAPYALDEDAALLLRSARHAAALAGAVERGTVPGAQPTPEG